MARILSVWLLHWPTTAWTLRQGARSEPTDSRPLALATKIGSVRRLHGLDAAAAGLGLEVGQKAADALALVPELRVEPADPQAEGAALSALCDWCSRFSPAVAPETPEGLFLDTTGLDHLWGGEAELMADLERRLAGRGITVRLGVADTVGAAWALARFAPGTIASPGRQADRIRDLPIQALRLTPPTRDQLHRLGIGRIRHLMAQPRAALSRRFGVEACLRLDQALGDAPEALAYRRPPTPWLHRLKLVEPISTPEDMARLAQDLARGLCARLVREGRAARRFEFVFHRLDGADCALELNLARPGRQPMVLMRLIRERLATVDPGFGIEEASILAREVEIAAERQDVLEADPAGQTEDRLASLVETLSNRLGTEAVWRPQPHESHEPERAVQRRPALEGKPPGGISGWDPAKPRPIRLFSHPEPIQATALLPDDPPLQFRWRGQLHRVRRAEGPERISREWWRQPVKQVGPGQVRDYYRVEDDKGGRYWLFRAGLHGQDQAPRWWLHGVFA